MTGSGLFEVGRVAPNANLKSCGHHNGKSSPPARESLPGYEQVIDPAISPSVPVIRHTPKRSAVGLQDSSTPGW